MDRYLLCRLTHFADTFAAVLQKKSFFCKNGVDILLSPHS